MIILQVTNNKLLKKFVLFPNQLYKNNPYYVPEMTSDAMKGLSKDKNPAFDFCQTAYFLAVRDDEIVGRIGVAINHRSNDKWGHLHARFNNFDFIDDLTVSKALMDKAEEWAKAKGMQSLKGPLGLTDMDHQGMLIEGFDELDMYITIYNAPYYKEHIQALGYAKDVDWLEYQVTMPGKEDLLAKQIRAFAKRVSQRYGYRLINFKTRGQLLARAEEIFALYNDVYAPLYGTSTLSDRQIDYYIKAFLGFVNPKFIKAVVDKENRLIGFAITMPSITKAMQRAKGEVFPVGFVHLAKALLRNDRLDLYLIGVVPSLRHTGVNNMLIDGILQTAADFGIKVAETGPMLEDNKKIRMLCRHFDTRQHRRRRSWIKTLG